MKKSKTFWPKFFQFKILPKLGLEGGGVMKFPFLILSQIFPNLKLPNHMGGARKVMPFSNCCDIFL